MHNGIHCLVYYDTLYNVQPQQVSDGTVLCSSGHAPKCYGNSFFYIRSQKRKRFVITLQKYYSTLYINYNAYYAKLQIVLQETTDCITQNYRLYYTKLKIML